MNYITRRTKKIDINQFDILRTSRNFRTTNKIIMCHNTEQVSVGNR